MRTFAITAVIGSILLFSFAAMARDHSALKGTWILAPTKATLPASLSFKLAP